MFVRPRLKSVKRYVFNKDKDQTKQNKRFKMLLFEDCPVSFTHKYVLLYNNLKRYLLESRVILNTYVFNYRYVCVSKHI